LPPKKGIKKKKPKVQKYEGTHYFLISYNWVDDDDDDDDDDHLLLHHIISDFF
jgi:hypothetical protein